MKPSSNAESEHLHTLDPVIVCTCKMDGEAYWCVSVTSRNSITNFICQHKHKTNYNTKEYKMVKYVKYYTEQDREAEKRSYLGPKQIEISVKPSR